jgi:ABC-type antimicrobial peptide transport system permease subunit
LVNERLVGEFGWENPIGQVLQVDDSTRLTVVGVMENLHMWGFWQPIDPLGIRPVRDESRYFVVGKSAGLNSKDLYDRMEAEWYEVAPNTPFNASFIDQELKETFLVNKNITIMFAYMGALALILSTIGLYTLVSLNVIKRIKEIGVRKVLGATIPNIILLVNMQFVMILVIASVLGAGLSYFAIDALMSSIWAYYQVVTLTSLLLPVLFLLIMALSTASGRILSAAVKNPVDSLRYE